MGEAYPATPKRYKGLSYEAMQEMPLAYRC